MIFGSFMGTSTCELQPPSRNLIAGLNAGVRAASQMSALLIPARSAALAIITARRPTPLRRPAFDSKSDLGGLICRFCRR